MIKVVNKKRVIKTACSILFCILLTITIISMSSCTRRKNTQNTDTGEVNFVLLGAEEWNGFYLGSRLYYDLINAEDEKSFVVQVLPVDDIAKDFTYNGKGCEEYKQEYKESQAFVEKLECLLEEGEALKYGELLCTTGTPDGEIWTVERYNFKTQEYYGKEIIDRYIVNGEFLSELVQNDLVIAKEEMKRRNSIMNEAELAGRRAQLEKALSLFKIVDDKAVIDGGTILLKVTKKSLFQIPCEYRGEYAIRYPLYVSST